MKIDRNFLTQAAIVVLCLIFTVVLRYGDAVAVLILNKANAIQMQGKPIDPFTAGDDGKTPVYNANSSAMKNRKVYVPGDSPTFGTVNAAQVNTTGEDGTHRANIGNSVQYTGPRTKGTIFHTISSMYVCETDNVCRRIPFNSTYTLPIASGSILGGVKVGTGLAIDGSGMLSSTVVGSAGATPTYRVIASSEIRVGNNYIIEAANITLTMRNFSSGCTSAFNNTTGHAKFKPSALGQRWRYRNYSATNSVAKYKNNTTANGFSVKLPPGETVLWCSYGGSYFTALMPTVGLAKTGVNEYAGGGGGGDVCTGTLLYSHHAENNDDATATANGVTGCSASVTYKSWTIANAAYSSSYAYDGTYSLYLNGYNHRATINNTGNWINLSATGSVKFWYRPGADGPLVTAKTDATHYLKVSKTTSSGDKIRVSLHDGTNNVYVTSSNTVSASGSVICAGWDDTSNLIAVTVDGTTTSQTATAWTTLATFTAWEVGETGSSAYGYFDGIKFYTTSNCQ